MNEDRPLIWILDSARTPLADFIDSFDWAETVYVGPGERMPEWRNRPDAVFFSAEIAGGAEGELFTELYRAADGTPLLAIAKLRSLAQAVALFRAGAVDYLSLPLYEEDAKSRFLASMERMKRQSMTAVMVELESVDGDEGDVSLTISPAMEGSDSDEDILAELATGKEPVPAPGAPEQSDSEDASECHDDEPIAVDGLPIPSLYDELPCGILVFDSANNLVFANVLALDLFGRESLAELQEALESRRAEFAAHGSNGKPLPDNQWPQVLAGKTRSARSAVVSIEKPDRRRVWLRIDCLPHLSDGRITRLSMTVVNLTGELPPLVAVEKKAPESVKKDKPRQHGKRRR